MWFNRRQLFLAALMAAFTEGQAVVSAAMQVGDPMPDWESYRMEGELPEMAGKVVLVDVWASWCGPCKASFPDYHALQAELADRGLVILAVSVDRKASDYRRFIEMMQPGFATLRDVHTNMVRDFAPPKMPTSYLFDRSGRLRAIHEGYRGRASRERLRHDLEPLMREASP